MTIHRPSRKTEVAQLADVSVDLVHAATPTQVRAAYADRAPSDVLEVALNPTGEDGGPVYFWRVGNTYYLDDATFGDVVAIDDLRYDPTLGLRSRHWK